ncbi:hypothetical protein OTU49_001513, partial [Cherax quadricarinatus]
DEDGRRPHARSFTQHKANIWMNKEGPKRKKNRKRSKKRTPLIGTCTSSNPGEIIGEPPQRPTLVSSEVEALQVESPKSAELGNCLRQSKVTSPRKGPSQKPLCNTGSQKTEPLLSGLHVTQPKHTEIASGDPSKTALKVASSNGPVSTLFTLNVEQTQQRASKIKSSKTANTESMKITQSKIRTSESETQPQVLLEGKTKLKQVNKKSPQKTSSSSELNVAQGCKLPFIPVSELLVADTHSSSIPAVNVENTHSKPNVKEKNTSSVTEETHMPNLPPMQFELNTVIMSEAKNKLDHLCNLLDSIVIEHSGKEGYSTNTVIPVLVDQTAKGTSEVAVIPSKFESLPGTVSECQGEKTKEDIEHERKARKEAKAMKKKGGDKSKSENDKQENFNCIKVEKKKAVQQGKPLVVSAVTEEKLPRGKQEPSGSSVPSQGTSQESTTAKSKADLKRERREKQEAQRQAKMIAKAKEVEKQTKGQEQVHLSNDKAKPAPKKKKSAGEGAKRSRDRRIPLLGHLPLHFSQLPIYPVNCDDIHPAVRTLGLKMRDRIVDGSTARVVSTLAALKRFINDYRTPESCDLSRDLAEKLLPNVAFLNACRPHAIAMDNAIRFLKHKVNSIEASMPEAQAKDELRTAIDDYLQENINLASSTIASHAASLIDDGDVILTFGYSAVLIEVVEAVCKGGSNISVVVVDSPHPSSGVSMVKKLSSMSVTTYYRLITDVTHIMHKVTKVVVEAEAVMMNGAIQGICGTAGLALAAATHDTPFIVLCHTYKFCNNDLTDSLVINELGDADSIVSCPSREYFGLLDNWRETQNLNVVSLVYDVTPACLVTALVTEQSVLPTSAVPVIIRRNYADILGQD